MDDNERTVDLKWSLWSMHKAHWEDRAPGVWDWMKSRDDYAGEGLDPTRTYPAPPAIVNTAPWKEIRYGRVEFFGEGSAEVHFYTEDDDDDGTPGTHIGPTTVEAESFEELMHLIDHREIDLLRASGENPDERCIECGYPQEGD